MKNTKFLILTLSITFLGLGVIIGQTLTDKAINLPQIKKEYISIVEGLYFVQCVESSIPRNTCLNQVEKITQKMKEEINREPYSTSLPIPQFNKQYHSVDMTQEDLWYLHQKPLLKI